MGGAQEALFAATGLTQVASVADLGGGALAQVIAAHDRWDCDITLIDMGANGSWSGLRSDWVAPYLAALEAAVDLAACAWSRPAPSCAPSICC